MTFKKRIGLITIAAFITLLTNGMVTYDLFAHDSDMPKCQTNLCSHCDEWFIITDSSQHLCPRCELLKDLTLLKTDPDFTAEKLDPQTESARREIAKKIETLEQSLWAKPNLHWTDTY